MNCNLRSCNFTETCFRKSKIADCDFKHAIFINIDLLGIDFCIDPVQNSI
ncbi:pentapeptide repeat-containing protein [Olivibacter sp. SDN3]|nr:pentapeptide repeat-containing protein [Olivibacter sp. SDN3]